jgi:hypothetical protein
MGILFLQENLFGISLPVLAVFYRAWRPATVSILFLFFQKCGHLSVPCLGGKPAFTKKNSKFRWIAILNGSHNRHFMMMPA